MRIMYWISDVCASDLACVLDCSLIARIDTKDGSSLCKALVDRRLRQADHARDLLGSFSFEQRVEAGAVFVRQPRPTLEVGLIAHESTRQPGEPEIPWWPFRPHGIARSEEHTSELQSLMRISYAVFCLKKTKKKQPNTTT